MDNFDFGFSFGEDYTPNNKIVMIKEIIIPFLEKLKGNKNQHVIKWNGEKRHQDIDDLIRKINEIGE